ncbi:efflux RND transporter periplasmic adaptor subunit [Halalkalibacillus halophilus]|uniref:efflux RND transporter periplasmic adaptor subunit n=1 Tax=Halalkalibacillus halophilus TaxID=392827 RepID=UPI0003FE9A34|nr:HlyD family efflux transporter periplasmic adaptor subunit [Halalkalibacillus halophilus]
MKKWMIILLIAAMTLLAACNDDGESEDEETQETEAPVEVTELEVRDFTTEKSFRARTMPSDEMPVIAEAPGEVDLLNVEQGDRVEEGDVLAEISSPQAGTYELEADMNGMIQQLNMNEGRAITNEEPAAIIVSDDPLEVSFSVSATDREKMSVDDEVLVTISQLDTETEAIITYVAGSAGENGLFDIEAEIEQQDETIPVGVTAQVYLEEVVEADAFIVPTEAIVERGTERAIFTVVEGEAVRVEIEVVSMQSEESAITFAGDEELSEGDPIVIRGQLTMSDGQPVRVMEEE